MTLVRRCDICDRTTEDYDDTDDNRPWGGVSVFAEGAYWDLCPQCTEKVREFVEFLASTHDPTRGRRA